MPSAVTLALELVSRADREVHGWVYAKDRAKQSTSIVLVLNALHPEVAAALNAQDAQKVA